MYCTIKGTRSDALMQLDGLPTSAWVANASLPNTQWPKGSNQWSKVALGECPLTLSDELLTHILLRLWIATRCAQASSSRFPKSKPGQWKH